MAFYGYRGDDTYDYYSTPYSYNNHASSSEIGEPPDQSFDYVSPNFYINDESFVTQSESYVNIYDEPELTQYDPIEYHDYYPSQVHHSYFNNYTITNSLQYEPLSYDTVYFPSETKFTISYSTVEFNEPDYEEYDPTPYSGGYDPVTTYGKSLPPSDKTCYPRSVPQSNGVSLANFSYNSIPSPYGKHNDPPNGSKPIDQKTDPDPSKNLNGFNPIDPKTDPDPSTNLNMFNPIDPKSDPDPSKNLKGSDPIDPKTDPDPSIHLNGFKPIDQKTDPESSVENGSDHEIGGDGLGGEIVEQSEVIPSDNYPSDEGRNGGDYGYESYNRVVNQSSYGSGLESFDICDGIFGYWPCLAKREQQQRQMAKFNEVLYQEIRDDPWKTAADYLFGNPVECDYEHYYR